MTLGKVVFKILLKTACSYKHDQTYWFNVYYAFPNPVLHDFVASRTLNGPKSLNCLINR